MNKMKIFSASLFLLGMFLAGCSSRQKAEPAVEAEKLEAAKGLHKADKHGEDEGEEDGTMLGQDEVYDVVEKGIHLVLKYNKEVKAFQGTVENVSDELQTHVRVEVHLSNGMELGPTVQADLEPGEKRNVLLGPVTEEFEGWSSHAEAGDHEHSHEGEHGHSHGEGEHSHSHGEGEHSHSHSHENGGHKHN